MLKLSFALALLTYFLTTFCNADSKPNPARIAVIGGGIGGMSSIYFLNEKFGKDVPIDLYEPKSTLCGRVATVNVNGRDYESGASIIHPKNMHMKNFVESFGLKHAANVDGITALFDGKDYILKTSTWSVLTFLKMLWLYGLDLFRINRLESHFMEKFLSIYDLQEQGYSYNDVESLLRAAADEEFLNATKVSIRKLYSDNGIHSTMIDTLVTGAIRNNYGQDATTTHGFVGSVSMAGIEPGLWSVHGGNKMVCEKIFEATEPNLIHEHVSSVTYRPESAHEAFSITTVENPKTTHKYDIVILAAPIGPNTYNIDLSKACEEFLPCPVADAKDMAYRQTVANFIVGKLNSSLFHCDSKQECPEDIFVPNTTLFYRSISGKFPVDYDPKIDTEDVMIYKVYTTEPMTKEQISYLFDSYNETTYVKWNAYPDYHVPQKLSSFVLNRAGLYYTSPIEWAASAMEMSAVSGKNAVLLAYNYWFGLKVKMNKIVYENGARNEL